LRRLHGPICAGTLASVGLKCARATASIALFSGCAEAREIVEGLVVDLDADGNVVGFDIDHACRKLDLCKVETIALPPAGAAE